MKKLLTIIIPCKNEEDYIGNLLDDLSNQKGIQDVPIIIADADSTDNTLGVIEYCEHRYPQLNIKVIKGGSVSYGRNRGAEEVDSKYLLFIDADVKLYSNNLLVDTISEIESGTKYLLTCKLKSYSNDWKSKLAFKFYNIVHYFLIKKYPFAIGAYFCVTKKEFVKYGMFNEKSDNSEDFLFSQNFKPSEFGVLNHFIGQDNRRFKKMGYIGMGLHLLRNLIRYMINGRTEFTKKSKYWE